MPLAAIRSQSTQCTLAEAWSSMHPPRVLLAEDDDELRTFLAAALRADGYEVVESRDGRGLCEEIAVVASRQPRPPSPDIIVSDVRMPHRTGLEALATLREKDASTAVILITGFGDRATHEEARRLGAAAVFDKPFDVDDLRTAVLNLVKRR
jgi:DNA-binding response OmpR family regulator